MVDYYGTQTPVTQLAGFQVPEARMVVISPYDKGSMTAIEKAIRDSDLGVNPTNDGVVIRVAFPQLTEDRRKEYIKVARHKAEDARISMRNIRRHAKDALDKLHQGRRGRRGRRPPRGEVARRPDAQVRRADRRPAQAQGGRAARGLRTSTARPPMTDAPADADTAVDRTRGPQPRLRDRRRCRARDLPGPAAGAVRPVGVQSSSSPWRWSSRRTSSRERPSQRGVHLVARPALRRRRGHPAGGVLVGHARPHRGLRRHRPGDPRLAAACRGPRATSPTSAASVFVAAYTGLMAGFVGLMLDVAARAASASSCSSC